MLTSQLINAIPLTTVLMQVDPGGEVNLSVSGIALVVALVALGGYLGYQRGFRAIVTVTLLTVIAYLLCVQGGDFVVGLINRIWSNGPRLGAFLLGNDINSVPRLDPLISEDFQIPLFFRFVLFWTLVALGGYFNKKPKWYAPSPNLEAEPLSPALGAIFGAFEAVLLISAVSVFWQELGDQRFGGPVAQFLNILPDLRIFVPSLIGVFLLVVMILMVYNLPKVWKS